MSVLGEISAPGSRAILLQSIPFPPTPLWKTLRCSSSVSVQRDYTDAHVHTHAHTCTHAYTHTPHPAGGAVGNISIVESAEGALPIERF